MVPSRKVTSSFVVLGLLFCKEARECDDIGIDLFCPRPSRWRIAIGSRWFGSHCSKLDADSSENQKRHYQSNRRKAE
jgi:hypothetical protein